MPEIEFTIDPTSTCSPAMSTRISCTCARAPRPGNLLSGLLEMREVVGHLPRRVATLLDRVANNEVSVEVDALDGRLLLDGLQTIANRITLGLGLAAPSVGAALLMSVPTPFQILGSPGLAIVRFLGAATGGALLAFSILHSDVRPRRPR